MSSEPDFSEPELPPPGSWIVERRPDTLVADLALHRNARLVPERFRDHHVEVPRALAGMIAEWIESPGACLYFTGPVGRGKTQAAWVAVLAWMAKTGTSGAWSGDLASFAVPHLFEELRRSYDSRNGADVVSQCVQAKLLFLDDFGAEKVSEWTRERMLEIINERYDHQRPLLITSNLAPAELEETQAPKLVSRLVEMTGQGKFVAHFSGPDRRRDGG
jgi:DNA replication protein DnaC